MAFAATKSILKPVRKTKIICTLGPATSETETLRKMIEQGADVFRLNMSHAAHEWVRTIVPVIRNLADEIGRSVAILLDTQGPAIRTGDLKEPLHLQPGDILEFTVRGAKSEEKYSVDVNYDDLVDDISVGDTVLVDNGMIRLQVLSKQKNRIRCKVLTAGTLGSRRHINLPGVRVNLPPMTKKDIADVTLGRGAGSRLRRVKFCPGERGPGGIAPPFGGKEKQSADRGQDRGSIGGACG